jgi:chromosome segregation ATPase
VGSHQSLLTAPRHQHPRLQSEVPDHAQADRPRPQCTPPLTQHHEYDNIRLADQQGAVLSKLAFLEKRIDALATARNDQAVSAEARQEKLREKIGEEQAKLRTLQTEREEESRRAAELSGQLEAIMLDV